MGGKHQEGKQCSALTEKWNVLGKQEKISKKEIFWKGWRGRMERG